MDELLEKLISSATYSGVRGTLNTLAVQLGWRTAVFATHGALIESRPQNLDWGHEEILAVGATGSSAHDLHVMPIKTDSNTIVAFFAIEGLEPGQEPLATAAAQLIRLELRRLHARAEGERALFRDVLDDIISQRSTPSEIESRLLKFGLQSNQEVKVVVGACRSPADRLANIPWETYALAGKLDSVFLRTAYRGAMVMVIPDRDLADEIAQTLLEALEELASPASVGISGMASLRGIRAAYFEALAASTNGTGIQTSGVLDLAALLAQNHVPASVTSASGNLLAPLVEYDQLHGTDYINTLRAYLQHDRKASSVAEVFFLHRNTIRYRLNQIAEILGEDIESTRNIVNLTIAMQLHEAGLAEAR